MGGERIIPTNNNQICLLQWLCLIVVTLCVLPLNVYADGVLKPGVDGDDCFGCHAGAGKLPDGHPDIVDMVYMECEECHLQEIPKVEQKMSLGHVHLLSEISCEDCHLSMENPAPLSSEDCFKCHGSAREVADLTIDLDPNPHNSIHYETDLDCDLCHHQHEPSENFCSQCHDSEFKVP